MQDIIKERANKAFKIIPSFPDYSISYTGLIKHLPTNYILNKNFPMRRMTSLIKEGRVYKADIEDLLLETFKVKIPFDDRKFFSKMVNLR